MANLDRSSDWARNLGTVDVPALGFLELTSISRGLYLTDVILKKAPVKVIASQPISSGKHIVLFFGDVSSVQESQKRAIDESSGTLIKEILIPAIHEGLVPFLDSIWSNSPELGKTGEAIGMVESQTLAGAILSADQALKSARVTLCKLRLGQGIGGKAYFILTGRQEEVEAALLAAEKSLQSLESFVRVDLIPNPAEESLAFF